DDSPAGDDDNRSRASVSGADSFDSKKGKSKRRSKRDSEIFDSPAEDPKRSKRVSRELDGNFSVVSSRSKPENIKEGREIKDKKGGGLFGIFSATKSEERLLEGKSREAQSGAGADDFHDAKRERKRKSSKGSSAKGE